MNSGYQHIKKAVRLVLHLQILVWIVLTLPGCGGNKNIPVASVLSSGSVTLSWKDVPGAASYDIFLSTTPGMTVLNSYKISDMTSPITITDLEPGTTYYFIVVVYSDSGESRKSKEVSHTVGESEGFVEFDDLLDPPETAEKSQPAAKTPTTSAPPEPAVDPKPEPGVPAAPVEKAGSEIIICFGDSLTFGTGATTGMDYPAQLARMIGKPVVNKGISGDTTASARRRLNRDVLSANPATVLITLGGNDLKNGVSKNVAFSNLKYIVETIQQRGAKVIIGGLKFPGMDRGFAKGYEALAKQTGATLVPNIFAGIFDNLDLMSDPIHPNNAGYRIIARRFSKALVPPMKTSQAVGKKPAPAATKKAVPAATPQTVPATTQKSSEAQPVSVADQRDVTLAWDNVSGATSYNIYWSDKPGVNKQNGKKIANTKNPYKLKGLTQGKKYYFVVTAANQSGESRESDEFSFTVGE